MSEVVFTLPEFEGPLDVLLHLISKHRLNLFDINITVLIDQYLSYIEQSEAMDLELTGDFLEMASRLVYMKSVMLLPRHEEEKEVLKAELQGQLIEYHICKQKAEQMRQMYENTAVFVRESMPGIVDLTYRRVHQPEVLVHALDVLQGKLLRKQAPPKTSFTVIVSKRVVSVTSKIIYVLRSLSRRAFVTFDSLFDKKKEKTENVATFLAVLELIRGKRIEMDDDGNIKMLGRKERK